MSYTERHQIQPHSSYILRSHRSPHSFFTPTNLSFADSQTGAKAGDWSSRRARKGRYAPKQANIHYVRHGKPEEEKGQVEDGKSKEKKETVERMEQMAVARIRKTGDIRLRPIFKMDVSFWVAVTFTLGSVVWVINGFLVWFPLLRPRLDTDTVSRTAYAMAFVGGTTFELGSYLMVIEALDRGREINFNTAIGQLLSHRRHTPHYATLDSSTLAKSSNELTYATSNSRKSQQEIKEGIAKRTKRFIWWGRPMWHDMGYMAAIIQFFAATVFWVSTLTGLPGVIPGYFSGGGSTAIVDVFYWTPQVVGGSGFIVSSVVLMIEVQKHWWLPNITDIGWWVAFWNLIGATGFTLCGALGYSSASGLEYESDLATFWGSWAFLIGSVVQVGEAVWREPANKGDGEGSNGGEE
ncbi:hypothetical protein C361_00609 [Cryptococcus neoformans Tu259-1]|uniref:Integral membrane protein n=1 Tax=Cryptococcus neoformans Tu259-1 TaxID=1230072 RepID=A0A854QLK6_CRYNE|nr:hypothetical protein C361_00609 [Cryptococcus neoformans var. grubii Tu259-1]